MSAEKWNIIGSVAYVFLVSVIGLELAVVLHELGHLVMGRLTGYSFLSFRVGSFVLTKEEGKWKIKRFGITGTAGQCLMIPPETDKPEKAPALLYHAGGGIFNLITAAISVAFCLLSGSLYVRVFFHMLGLISLILGITNLIPQKAQVPNDGYNIWRILKSEADRIAIYNILRISGYQDLSPGEMPVDVFIPVEKGCTSIGADQDTDSDDKGAYSRVSKMMYGYYLLDRKEFPEAEEMFAECAKKDEKSFTYYRLEAAGELLFCKLIRDAAPSEIILLYDRELAGYINKNKKLSIGKRRILYAYQKLFMKDEDAAAKEYEEAMKLASSYPAKGDVKMELSLLEFVKNLRREEEQEDLLRLE